MMDNKDNSYREYEVLGLKVRYRPEAVDNGVSAQDVIGLVNCEMGLLKSASPGLSREECAVLAALKLAQDYISLKEEYKNSLQKMDTISSEILGVIEEIKS
ncbi:MAG: cell division protein ZapA [Oligoflexia bacterium]|nr:cell division protein ZapA [Oligoflexia bacterium]